MKGSMHKKMVVGEILIPLESVFIGQRFLQHTEN